MSSMIGSGQLHLLKMLFSFLKSIQNLLVVSLFVLVVKRTIGKLQGDLDGCMIFAANMSFTTMSKIGCLAKGVLYGLNSRDECLPVSIIILIVLVPPKSVSFSAEVYSLFY